MKSCKPGALLRQCAALLAILPLFATAALPSYGRTYKKVHADGTVEFYNTQEPEKEPRKRGPAKSVQKSRFDGLIEEIASRNAVDPFLIKCVVKIESDFNPNAVSSAGAIGLMQIMMETAKYYHVTDPFDPGENLRIGVKHLGSLLDHFKGDVPLALAAYHAGLSRVKKAGSIPPIRSTINYVNSVMRLYNGTENHTSQVKKLYQKIDKDGTLLIYSK